MTTEFEKDIAEMGEPVEWEDIEEGEAYAVTVGGEYKGQWALLKKTTRGWNLFERPLTTATLHVWKDGNVGPGAPRPNQPGRFDSVQLNKWVP